jgi:fumarate reductase flavoprotein subunit
MKKTVALILSLCLILGCLAFASAETKTESAQGFASEVSVEVTLEGGKVTALTVNDADETYTLLGYTREETVDKLIADILKAGGTDGVDAHTGATFTSTAVLEAVNKVLAAAGDDAAAPEAAAGDNATAPEAAAGNDTAAPEASASAETKTESAQGFASEVTVEVTLEGGKVTALTVNDADETYTLLGYTREETIDKLIADILKAGGTDGVDAHTGATFTSTAVLEAVNKVLAAVGDDAAAPEAAAADDAAAPLAFTAGTYEATAKGFNGPVAVKVTFSDTALTAIEIISSDETEQVGNAAFPIMMENMLACNGSGVDSVSGASFSSEALRTAVNDAAQQAKCTNLDAFMSAGSK